MGDSKRVFLYVGIGCALILIVGACIVGSCFYFAADAFSGPRDAAHSFFKDLRTANYPQALQRMNTGYQQTHPVPTFQQSVASLPALTLSSDATLLSTNVENSTARIEGFLTTPQGNVPVALRLSKLGEFWYIDTVSVGNVPLQ